MSDKSVGYIKIHRKIFDNPVVCKDSEYFSVWIYLLANATHKNLRALFKGKDVTLLPGQLLTGRTSISKKLKICETKVQRILKTFESEQQIEQQTSNQNRLITIVNWKEYQQSEQHFEQQVNNNRTTSEQQVNTNNNDNNDNNVLKNVEENTYCAFFDSVWELYPNKKGKSKVNKKSIEELQDLGYEKVKECIEQYKLEKPEWQQWQNGSTFFNGGYLDYMTSSSANKERQRGVHKVWQ